MLIFKLSRLLKKLKFLRTQDFCLYL